MALGLLALAAAARLLLLAKRPLWHDEIFTVWISRLDAASLLDALRNDSGPPLFYVLEKPFVAAAEASGVGDAFARWLPWAATILLAGAARALPGDRARALFLGLLATSPLLTLYAAEARAYAPLALSGTALALVALRGGRGRGRFFAAAALSAATLFLHYLGAILVAAIVLTALARRRRPEALAVAAGGLPFLAWVPTLLAQPAEATAWLREDPLSSAAGFLSGLGGAGRIPAPFGAPLPPGLVAAGLVAALAAGAAALSPAGRAAAAPPLLAAALYLAGVLAVSAFRPVGFAGRSEVAVVPLFLWGVAAAAETSRAARRAGLALAAVGALSTIVVLVRGAPAEPGSAALVRGAAARASAGDVAVAGGSLYLPARLAADRGTLRARLVAFPRDVGRHPGWFRAAPPEPSETAALLARLAETPRGSRAFFLLHPLLFPEELARGLEARGPLATLAENPEGALVAWSPEAPAPHPPR